MATLVSGLLPDNLIPTAALTRSIVTKRESWVDETNRPFRNAVEST